MGKGISLTLETVVILILAITVMAVLLYFLYTRFYAADKEVGLREKQREGCFRYTQYDPKCEGTRANPNDPLKPAKEGISQDLKDACSQLEPTCLGAIDKIDPDQATLACIQRCCALYCARKQA